MRLHRHSNSIFFEKEANETIDTLVSGSASNSSSDEIALLKEVSRLKDKIIALQKELAAVKESPTVPTGTRRAKLKTGK
jgi:hypothetical protein